MSCVYGLPYAAACGNGRCEYSEQCKDPWCSTGCPVDCPSYSHGCPVGRNSDGLNATCSSFGTCQSLSTLCSCYTGYSGVACEVCAPKYHRVSSTGRCVYLTGNTVTCDDGVKNGNEEGVDCGGPNCVACAGKSGPWFTSMMFGVVVGSVVGLLLIAMLSIWKWRRKREKPTSRVQPQSVTLPSNRGLRVVTRQVVIGNPVSPHRHHGMPIAWLGSKGVAVVPQPAGTALKLSSIQAKAIVPPSSFDWK